MQMFELNSKKHDFDHNIRLRGTTGILMYQFFSRSMNLKVPDVTAPLI